MKIVPQVGKGTPTVTKFPILHLIESWEGAVPHSFCCAREVEGMARGARGARAAR